MGKVNKYEADDAEALHGYVISGARQWPFPDGSEIILSGSCDNTPPASSASYSVQLLGNNEEQNAEASIDADVHTVLCNQRR